MALIGFVHPVPMLADGRKPKVSSGFQSSSRPTHHGVDVMYPRAPGDPGTPGKHQLPTTSPGHFMPSGIPAFATGPGVVSTSKQIGTGGYVVINHPAGITSQYMHLFKRRVKVGDEVKAGDVVGDIGFNPSGFKLLHLHFQIRDGGRLINPKPILANLPILEIPSGVGRFLVGFGISVALGLVAAKYVFR